MIQSRAYVANQFAKSRKLRVLVPRLKQIQSNFQVSVSRRATEAYAIEFSSLSRN